MSTSKSGPSSEGGCACGAVRYRLEADPLFVHCCHCTRCQREMGGPFAHHVLIEFTSFTVLSGEPVFNVVPADSRVRHWIARCPVCYTALWSAHGSRQPVTLYVKAGTLDAPGEYPPKAHIYARSKQPWVVLTDDAPANARYYDSSKVWPLESQARWQAASEAKKARRRPGVTSR